MLLCLVKAGCGEVSEDLAGDVALEAAADSGLGLALFFASFDVVTGGFVVSHAGVRDGFQGGVELSVAGAVEAMVLGVV